MSLKQKINENTTAMQENMIENNKCEGLKTQDVSQPFLHVNYHRFSNIPIIVLTLLLTASLVSEILYALAFLFCNSKTHHVIISHYTDLKFS
jgi:hypothetical protein